MNLYNEQTFQQASQLLMSNGDMAAANQAADLYASHYPRSPAPQPDLAYLYGSMKKLRGALSAE